ncbi:hypothetical protein [Streptomyces acidicola]|uniref:hypothetical protein n=1 Tax=Streptomyces acidicola TaxID=2596892 RepID=UPI003807E648
MAQMPTASMFMEVSRAWASMSRLKQHRAVATRFGKLAVRFEATVQVAAIHQWL